jgi:hypothetical protein
MPGKSKITPYSVAFHKILLAIIALVGWYALSLQFYLMVQNSEVNGMTVTRSVTNFFSYFTILSNLLVALSTTVRLMAPAGTAGRFFSHIRTYSAICLYITIVGLVYSIALRRIWNPQGQQLIADRLLHDVIPLLFLLTWIIFTPRKQLVWKNILSWLAFPAAYLVFTLIRGNITGWYPYPFIHAGELGYAKVALNAAMVLIAFIIVGTMLISINRMSKKGSP